MPEQIKISEHVVNVIQRELLAWYRRHRRNLPWRKNKDPYRVWVSEMMLQQTRVETVIPFYENFLQQFPTMEDLAQATDEQVVKAWEGLGYYARVRHLHSAVKEVVAHYGGKVPDHPETISKLKGVGPYTSGAILSIAYDQPVAAVDGNVMRVFARLFAISDELVKLSTRQKMEQIAVHLIPAEAPGDFNQALMELGALLCTTPAPQCLFCPVQSVCHAFQQGIEQQLPVKKKAKPPQKMEVVVAWMVHQHTVLIEKRPKQGLLAGMWSLPTIEVAKSETPLQTLAKFCAAKKISAKNYRDKGSFKHLFSHRHWQVRIVEAEVEEITCTLLEKGEWLPMELLPTKAFPTLYKKVMEQMIQN
jgi:A/G-specific adenine glycosylase